IRKAIDELLTAKRPVIYTGGGVVQGNASALLTELAHLLGYPVQQAMVDMHGSQCGFCTPGFIMSLWSMYENEQQSPSKDKI
ncbi:2Fe-2S iron-sulfur cluster-binding protein, partial [Acinetobacter nosocomialis]|uniref:2Fe-2S iron-sulfur cluster-binding protein n=1 Tax=Acinetobacter nosocomialis TaxID=106654 RepID=UPI001D184303